MALSFVTGSAMAATYTAYMTAHPATDPGAGAKGTFWQMGYVNLGDTVYFSSGVTNGDVIQLVNMPTNSAILSIIIDPTTAAIVSGTSCTVGDGADPDGYVTAGGIALDSATGSTRWTADMASDSAQEDAGAYFDADSGISEYVNRDTVDIVMYVDKAAAAAGVTPAFKFMIECIKIPIAR